MSFDRSTLGALSEEAIGHLLDRHVRDHLDTSLERVTFRAGAVGAAFGLRLADGRDVVLKVVWAEDATRLESVLRLQNRLAVRGFRCPAVLAGPDRIGAGFAVVEERLTCRATGDPHSAEARAAMADGLAQQIRLLSDQDGSGLVTGRPGWANWDTGAWPVPHDPIFDFSTPAPGYEWIDEAADAAARVLQASDRPAVIGHSDWVWQNVCVHDGRFAAGYDWDSLVLAPESAVIGLCAGAYTQGSPQPPDAPSAFQVREFIGAYENARGSAFDPDEHRIALAAARWVRCYAARCQVDNLLRRDMAPPTGSFLDQLGAEPDLARR